MVYIAVTSLHIVKNHRFIFFLHNVWILLNFLFNYRLLNSFKSSFLFHSCCDFSIEKSLEVLTTLLSHTKKAVRDRVVILSLSYINITRFIYLFAWVWLAMFMLLLFDTLTSAFHILHILLYIVATVAYQKRLVKFILKVVASGPLAAVLSDSLFGTLMEVFVTTWQSCFIWIIQQFIFQMNFICLLFFSFFSFFSIHFSRS